MKWVLTGVGGLLILMGIVWILQGINVLPGSFMSGKLEYAVLGFVVDVVGILLVLFANRRPRGQL
ncbi:MAG TPA: hypothetical protein VF326_13410 [Anaerolineaceae bacterium]|jgi:hypothetical protein